MKNKIRGFTFIELIIFTLIAGTMVGILLPFTLSLRDVHKIDHQTIAILLAQERMELIMLQKKVNGFNGFSDPCAAQTPPSICTQPSGYTVTATIADNWNNDTNYKVITVTTSGNGDAQVTTLVARY